MVTSDQKVELNRANANFPRTEFGKNILLAKNYLFFLKVTLQNIWANTRIFDQIENVLNVSRAIFHSHFFIKITALYFTDQTIW
jgi:hypothetical protein